MVFLQYSLISVCLVLFILLVCLIHQGETLRYLDDVISSGELTDEEKVLLQNEIICNLQVWLLTNWATLAGCVCVWPGVGLLCWIPRIDHLGRREMVWVLDFFFLQRKYFQVSEKFVKLLLALCFFLQCEWALENVRERNRLYVFYILHPASDLFKSVSSFVLFYKFFFKYNPVTIYLLLVKWKESSAVLSTGASCEHAALDQKYKAIVWNLCPTGAAGFRPRPHCFPHPAASPEQCPPHPGRPAAGSWLITSATLISFCSLIAHLIKAPLSLYTIIFLPVEHQIAFWLSSRTVQP